VLVPDNDLRLFININYRETQQARHNEAPELNWLQRSKLQKLKDPTYQTKYG